MQEEKYDPYRHALIHILIVLGGAMKLMEEEGRKISGKLETQKCPHLCCALESIGYAIELARDQADIALLHGVAYPNAPSLRESKT